MLPMFQAFKSAINKSPIVKSTIHLGSGLGFVGFNALLTHYTIKDYPNKIQTIYWDNFMDVEACKTAMERHYKNKPK